MTIDLDPDDPVNYEEESGDVNEDDEMEYLKELERLDRLIMAAETEKAASAAFHNKAIRDYTAQRNAILDEIEKFRLGERGLPYGEND